MPIIFIGGFGANENYSQPMCAELQRLLQTKVFNIRLHHGYKLEQECRHIIETVEIQSFHPFETAQKITVIGFSTGCLVALNLCCLYRHWRIILINPAEILTRMNRNLLDSVVTPDDKLMQRNIHTFQPMFRSAGFSVAVWKILWLVFTWVYGLAHFLFGTDALCAWYYAHFGRGFHEPKPDGIYFAPNFCEMKTTLVECLLKPSLHSMLRQQGPKIVHIIQGTNDVLYLSYVKVLFEGHSNVLLHRTTGDHHMVYHRPMEMAAKISQVASSF